MDILPGLHWRLCLLGVVGVVLGLWPLVWMLRRFARVLFRRPQPSVGAGRYFAALIVGALLFGAGATALGLAAALDGWSALGRKTHIAEVQCIELDPGRLRLYYVPIEPDGARGATEQYELRGDEWTVGGDLVRFRPFLSALHVDPVYKVTRVEGRWLRAEDANRQKPTAYDRAGGTGSAWLALYREGGRAPLRWLVAGVHGQAVSQLPDRRAVYELYLTPNGLVLEKRSL
jgi:hypothetical protein